MGSPICSAPLKGLVVGIHCLDAVDDLGGDENLATRSRPEPGLELLFEPTPNARGALGTRADGSTHVGTARWVLGSKKVDCTYADDQPIDP